MGDIITIRETSHRNAQAVQQFKHSDRFRP